MTGNLSGDRLHRPAGCWAGGLAGSSWIDAGLIQTPAVYENRGANQLGTRTTFLGLGSLALGVASVTGLSSASPAQRPSFSRRERRPMGCGRDSVSWPHAAGNQNMNAGSSRQGCQGAQPGILERPKQSYGGFIGPGRRAR